jgi:HK97 family phage prohead protease
MEHRSFVCDYKADAKMRRFSGYASVFGTVDSYGDRVMPNAFANTLQKATNVGRLPSMLWQHNPTQPIGKWIVMREDTTGLFVEGELADTQLGRETYSLLKMGALSGLSIGFSIPKGGSTYDRSTDTRDLTEIELWEVSPVTFPANVDARISSVKSAPKTIREFEKLLRDAGFSRAQAEFVSARGFKGLTRDELAVDDEAWMSNIIARFRA